MKAIVLAGGFDQIALIEELKRRGYEVILVDYFTNPPAKCVADRHMQISTLDLEAVLQLASAERVDIVTTACNDQALLTAAWVAERLELPFPLSFPVAKTVTNKARMKGWMEKHGIPTARTCILNDDEVVWPPWSLPWVVKPVDCNSSKGVERITRPEDYTAAVLRAKQLSRTRGVVVEEFLAGPELSVDVQVCGGVAEILLITKSIKNRYIDNAFPIVQSRHPINLSPAQLDEVRSVANRIATALGLDNTFLLIQFIATQDGLRVIEFSARIGGGAKYYLLSRVTGSDVISVYVESHFGPMPRLRTSGVIPPFAMNYIYCHPGVFRAITGVEQLIERGIVTFYCVNKTAGMAFHGKTTSSDRAGAVLVEGLSEADLQNKVAEADARLKVESDAGRDLMIHGLWNG